MKSNSMSLCLSIACRIIGTWLLFITLTQAEDGRLVQVDFDAMTTGQPPQGFTAALTGEGGPGRWVIEVRDDANANAHVLAQTSAEKNNYRFPLCLYNDFTGKDLELTVRFRPVSGQVDQAAGLVWRYRDANNYYIVRANALENNVVLYKVENGKRSDLKPVDGGLFAYGKAAPVPSGRWSMLRVTAVGDRFSVYLNDTHLFDVIDDTFRETGKVGLWTKADSVTEFDDLIISSLDQE